MEQVTSARPATDAAPPYVLVDQHCLDLTTRQSGHLKLSFSSTVWDSEFYLVIDLYSAANSVHPAGHVGWWKWPLEIKGDLGVEIAKGPDGFTVTFEGAAPHEFWKNPDFLGLEEAVIAVHVVLRPVISEAVRFDDILYLYNASTALEAARQTRQELEHPRDAAPSVPCFVWPRQSMVHLVATNVFERDAVGNFIFSMYRLLRANALPCQLYASYFDPALRGSILNTCELLDAASEDDLVLVHFSIFDPWLPRLGTLPSKKILYFHNITPPRFLQVYDAEFANHCADGLAQLKHLEGFDALMANSRCSALVLHESAAKAQAKRAPRESHFQPSHGPFEEASRLLEKALAAWQAQEEKPQEVTASPPLIGIKDWSSIPPQSIDLPPQKTLLLYVGRIAPHKRIEDLFALFDRYRVLNPDSALLLVGGARFGSYVGFLRYLIDNEHAKLKNHIHFFDSVSDGQLKTIYQRCAALVTMSEHEGFCVPLIEAMAFDKPVFAYAEEAVLETLGHSGRAFHTKDFEAIAADLQQVLTTPWMEQRILLDQRQRLSEISAQADGQILWSVLEKVMFGARVV